MALPPPYRHIIINLFDGMDPNEIYTCQIEDRSAVEAWVANPELRDPRLASSNWCAICCTRTILLAEDRLAPSCEELFEGAQDCHVYQEITDGEDFVGWKGAFHQDFVIFLWMRLRLWAQAERGVDLGFIRQRLFEGYYVLASVHPNIRFPDSRDEPEKKGGHFVLIYGFEIEDEACWFFIMNSAGFVSQFSQVAVRVPNYRLRQLFSGNVILVRSRKCGEYGTDQSLALATGS